MSGARSVPAGDVASLVAALAALPDSCREYSIRERMAQRFLGRDPARLETLRALGLSSRVRDGERWYEWGDVHFLGLRLGTASQVLFCTRAWAAAAAAVGSEDAAMRISYFAPDAGQGERLRVTLPDGTSELVRASPGKPVADFDVTLRASWPQLQDAALRAVAEEVRKLEFFILPWKVVHDTARARRTGLAACITTAMILVAEGSRLGLEMRRSTGLLVAAPFASGHDWAEVRVGGTWLPIDPMMVEIMTRFGGLERASWPTHRTLGPLLVRVDASTPLVADPQGRPVRASFAAQRASARTAC